MTKSNSQDENKNERPRFSQEQYDFLKRCSEKGEEGIKEWNEWRKKHAKEDIYLEGASLSGMYLVGVLLNSGGIKNTETGEYEKFDSEVHLKNANFRKTNLKQAKLRGAFLQKAHLACAHLEGADLCYTQLNDAYLKEAHLEDALLLDADLKDAKLCLSYLNRAKMMDTHLERAILTGASLKDAHLENAHLEGAYLNDTDMQKAEVRNAHLEGATLEGASLMSAHFLGARVDGNTNMWKVRVNQLTISTAKNWSFTDFSGVQLENIIIDPPTKQLLEYNVRRKYWYKWITEKNWNEVFTDENKVIHRKFLDRCIHSPVHLFFWISDYGLRIWRIIGTFLVLALFFAAIYSNMAFWFPPGIVSKLAVEPHLPLWHYRALVFIRPIYFSIVTMTTLGFGDMYANAQSIWGHILLTFQVILGYVLLGALVTRFAVLFTAGGPAGKFADEKEKQDKEK